jgi:hypothetical protein
MRVLENLLYQKQKKKNLTIQKNLFKEKIYKGLKTMLMLKSFLRGVHKKNNNNYLLFESSTKMDHVIKKKIIILCKTKLLLTM